MSDAPRWPCPVCLGVMMEKAAVGAEDPVTVDHCLRCGGIWFELGEVQRLRSLPPGALWDRIGRRTDPEPARCHACHAHVDPDADRCPACRRQIRLRCPSCERDMERVRHGHLTLDVCGACKGVWFDHHELAAIWSAELGQAMARRPGLEPGTGSLLLMDALIWTPDLVFLGAHGAAHAVAAAAEGLAHAPEAITGAVEVAGEAAAGVFEVILGIIGEIFS